MAIRLNLYHEVMKVEALKRRDPLKLSMYGLSAVVMGLAGYYLWQVMVGSGLKRELAGKVVEFQEVERKAKLAKAREEELEEVAKVGVYLVKKAEGRFYWGPVLEQIAGVVPAEVQLTRLVGGVSGEGVKRCVVTIDGMSVGAEPRRVAENLRKALAEKLGVEYGGVTAKFRSLEDTAEGLALGGKNVSGATFAIQAEFRMGEEVVVETGRRKR